MKKEKIFSPAIVLLSLVSLFNDISSELLIPILPVYLSSIGFSALYIGVLEGFAEAVTGLTKGYFGKLSDARRDRVSFIRWGYAMSAVGKSMLAVFSFPVWVFISRTMDRLGKGVRTAARDALLADESKPGHRGKVFGFHRAMDTVGAAIGPALALLYLYYHPNEYRTLFLIAFLPACLAVALTFILKEKKKADAKRAGQAGLFSFFGYWKTAGSQYRRIVTGFLLFALFNSSDAFIFLVGKHNGLDDTTILASYIFFNVVFALLALPMGHLADRIGMKSAYATGVVFFAIAYFLFPLTNSVYMFLAAFLVYAVYAAASDGIARAWITRTCDENEKATALGFYSGMLSIMVLSSNILAGFIWSQMKPVYLFYFSAGGAILVFLYFLVLLPRESGHSPR